MRERLLLITLFALIVAAGGWVIVGRGPDSSKRYVSEHSAPVPEAARTVVVSATMPLPSGHRGQAREGQPGNEQRGDRPDPRHQ